MKRTVRRAGAMALVVSAALAWAGAAAAKCQIQQLTQIPVQVQRGRLVIQGEVNHQPAEFMLDTGSARSLLFATAMQRYGLVQENQYNHTDMIGVGGNGEVGSTHVRQIKLGSFEMTDQDMRFQPTGGLDAKLAGLIGLDTLTQNDLEFDLAHGVLRILRPSADCSDDDMAYWGGNYAVSGLHLSGANNDITVDLKLNDTPTQGIMDTGAPVTLVSTSAAGLAGVTPRSAGVERLGWTGGLGPGREELWSAPFDSFAFGEEKIAHPRLLLSDFNRKAQVYRLGSRLPEEVDAPEVLVGLDFFRSHRVLVSRTHRKVYVSYLGGPVFGTPAPHPQATATPVAPAQAAAPKPVASPPPT